MLKNFLLIGMGGAIGSMLRYGTSLAIGARTVPLATFLINIIGSFLIGLIVAWSFKNEPFALNWKLFLATGICGGFTTFSAFSLESLQLIQQEKLGIFMLYAAGSVLFGVAAVWLGFKVINFN